MPAVVAPTSTASAKSGLKHLKAGDLLFNDGDFAESLYIIQKGQLRLYKPKGKGFIEIAVLRVGEVIGEMAYFDDDGSGRRRSCSAKAMVDTDVIEISFAAFGKTLDALNPWFKTIINTLASRLRKSNARIKELESNSVSHNYGGAGASTYEFLRTVDVVKALSVMFLVLKGHGEPSPDGVSIHRNTISFYAFEIFNVMEARFDEVLHLLIDLNLAMIAKDKEGQPKLIVIRDLEMLRSLLVFFNSQRVAAEDKKLKISFRCETFLEKILAWIDKKGMNGNKALVLINDILNDFKEHNIHIDLTDLEDAQKAGFLGEPVVGDGNQLTVDVQLARLRMSMPSIRMMNAITKFNEKQAPGVK